MGSAADERCSVAALFYEAFKEFWGLLKGNESEGATAPARKTGQIFDTLRKFHRLAYHVERSAVFSPNEELDDVNTSDLKFLLVPFALAELSNAVPLLEDKVQRLDNALVYWATFIRSLERLGACSKKDLDTWSREGDSLSAAARRAEKIDRYKRGKEVDLQLEHLFNERKQRSGDPFEWGNASGDFEEEERSLVLLLLERAVAESIEHRELALQELELLRMMQKVNAQVEEGDDERQKERKEPLTYITIGARPDELRQHYLDKVFKPFHELPSITLAEVAEWEMAYEVDQLGGRGTSKQPTTKHEDDNDNMSEAQEMKDREWDDWKDHNPKGWGNKQRNVG